MILFLHGADSYRRSEKLKGLVSQYGAKNKETDFLEVDLGENPEGWERARDFLVQPSLFASKKLAIVRESGAITELADFSKEAVKSWREAVKACVLSERTFLVVSDLGKPAAGLRFLAEAPVRSQEFEILSGDCLKEFLTQEAKRQGVALEPAALGFLAKYVESAKDERSWAAINVLKQVSLAGFAEPVSLDSLRSLIFWSAHDESFQLALGMMKADLPERRLLYLESLFSGGDAPRHILNLLSSLARSGRDVFSLARYDELVKSGRLDDEAALLAFALSQLPTANSQLPTFA